MTIGANVREVSPGNVEITCEQSGRPFTRTTASGMFCDAEDCVCERQSKNFENGPEFAQLKGLVDLFSQ